MPRRREVWGRAESEEGPRRGREADPTEATNLLAPVGTRCGAWFDVANFARCACRDYLTPADYLDIFGMRCGRGQ
jgi:hypothetical protein